LNGKHSYTLSIIRITTEAELEAIHTETLINSTNKVTKVTDHSVVRGLIRGNVRTGKKALKDIALAVSRLFPDLAHGSTLDEVADDHGTADRFAASQSSTYVRLIGDNGTVYQQGVHVVSDNKGNVFDLEEDVTLGVKGYAYVKVRSQQSGSGANVDPFTIVNITPVPAGHIGLINEYGTDTGRDVETDDIFRQRIKGGPNILARKTLAYLTQAFMKINPNVLRVIYEGVNTQGKVVISILTVNGVNLTQDELDTILIQGGSYFALTELNPIGTTSYGVSLKNAEYYPIDVTLRMELFVGASFASVVKEIQQKFAKYADFRFWDSSSMKVEWDTLLNIVKNTEGVKYVPDAYFTPNVDIRIPPYKFPRFRGFIASDLTGSVIINQTGTIDPIFYPNEVDPSFSLTIL
jgi:hypothetical protein